MSRGKCLPQHRDGRVGQRFPIFICNPAAHHGRGLHADLQILEFLPGCQSQYPPVAARVMFIRFQKPGPLGKQTIASGNDALNPEDSVCAGHGGVVPASGLALGNQLDHRFLDRLAARLFGDDSTDHGGARGSCGIGWNLGRRTGADENNRETCKNRFHGLGSKGWEVNCGRGDRPHSPYFILNLPPAQAQFQPAFGMFEARFAPPIDHGLRRFQGLDKQ
ncbi:hypothetical protein SBA1_270040 [Candidatus Sulfotelmatobacter kueseliae]|uniref:Uncharacterized protein n=1 Tax=Candidatus Sulfotelmatobacter kueseliae TaxID=2042962 RepID=A0A2U3KI27_9BACT|nr:hypothetical protein SBA1_270040 [Candidatus Sulfotelmatobacter kueseliae]